MYRSGPGGRNVTGPGTPAHRDFSRCPGGPVHHCSRVARDTYHLPTYLRELFTIQPTRSTRSSSCLTLSRPPVTSHLMTSGGSTQGLGGLSPPKSRKRKDLAPPKFQGSYIIFCSSCNTDLVNRQYRSCMYEANEATTSVKFV